MRSTDVAKRTGLIGGDIERDVLVGVASGQLRHAVDGLQQEAVVGVGLQVSHHHRGVGHAHPPWQEAHAGPALFQAPTLGQKTPAQHVVAHVATSAGVGRQRPLQEHTGLVDVGNETAGGRGRTWRSRRREGLRGGEKRGRRTWQATHTETEEETESRLTRAGHGGRVRLSPVVPLLAAAAGGAGELGGAVRGALAARRCLQLRAVEPGPAD